MRSWMYMCAFVHGHVWTCALDIGCEIQEIFIFW